MSAKEALRNRSSFPKVGDEAPKRKELLKLLSIAGTVADHANLTPWRFIEVRGESRKRLGQAIAEVQQLTGKDAERAAAKPLRAPLLLAIVAQRDLRQSKVPLWEQDATAAGVAHALSLLIDEAGWGVMWRTGLYTRSPELRTFHQLSEHEELMGWLYIGSKVTSSKPKRKLKKIKLKLSKLKF